MSIHIRVKLTAMTMDRFEVWKEDVSASGNKVNEGTPDFGSDLSKVRFGSDLPGLEMFYLERKLQLHRPDPDADDGSLLENHHVLPSHQC